MCHLSDIHFRVDKKNSLLDKRKRLSEAIRSSIQITSNSNSENRIFFVITGDIAYSGKSEEYDIALDLMIEIEEEIKKELGEVQIEYIIAPGNHDCDFSTNTSVRENLLENIKYDSKIDEDFISSCTLVQQKFNDFVTMFNKGYGINRIRNLHEYEIKNKRIVFQVFNTSWMSQKHEIQGNIIIPIDVDGLDEVSIEDYDLAVTLFHHPLNWIEANNKIEFKELIEKTSDIIFTGHEHTPEFADIKTKDKYSNKYIAGGELQNNDNEQISRFNVMAIDLEERKEAYIEYSWDGEMYNADKSVEWSEFKRNRYVNSKIIYINNVFKERIRDSGINLSKSGVDTIYLEDIYVYPNLELLPQKPSEDMQASKNDETKNKDEYKDEVKSKDVREFILNSDKILISGEEDSGKTALSKMIYNDFLDNGIIPLMINGADIKFRNEDKFKNTEIGKNFEKQYSRDMLERYKQLPKKQKAIIIDDFQKISPNDTLRKSILVALESMFEKIIILIEDDLMLQQVMGFKETNKQLDKYKKYTIKEFGYKLRSELIKKWICLGVDMLQVNPEEIDQKCMDMENKIDIAMGKNLFPKHPIFILLILQQFETRRTLDTISSYGYLYESLIIDQLRRINKSVDEISMNSTYLSELAYYMFDNAIIYMEQSDIAEFTDRYNKKYAMRLNEGDIINKYLEANIFIEENKRYRFLYKYVYYYFVSKHLRDKINSDEIKAHIRNMSSKLYNEDYANIILFLCHLTKEDYIINEILTNSRNIFVGFEPYDLENHYDFIKNMNDRISNVTYVDTEPQKNREALLESRDQAAVASDMLEEEYQDLEEYKEDDENIKNIMEINKSYKTMQILGQIVKNYPGSLTADLKYQITIECYCLALRTLSVFMRVINDNIEKLAEDLKELYLEQNKGTEFREAEKELIREEAKKYILKFSEVVTVSIIKKVSESVSNDKLSEIYKSIIADNDMISFKIIDISVKLDSQKSIPEADVLRLNKELGDNSFSKNILNHLIVMYFYFYKCDIRVKQRVCKNLGISYKKMRILEAKNTEAIR